MPEALHFQIDEYYLDLQKQGQDMAIMDREQTQRNPFPGLRPFRTGEAHLFFGREGQAEELIARLMQTHFLGVLGNSGSGKSSLVRAGLIPALHAGKKQQRIADWKIVICRPGNSPVQNLAAALAGANKNTTEEIILLPEVQRLLPVLRESSFGLLEAEAGTSGHGKTLLIVDQFEELFRFEREIPPGEAAHFVDLLLTAVRQEGSNLYAVVTMRSEFLGECVRYRGLPEIINEGQYLVPRLTGENVRRAVARPLGVVDAPVDPTLVNRLVREVGDNMDQLPLLQHALMRTYQHWQQRKQPENAISHTDYETVGGIEKALSQHANECFAALDDDQQRIAKLIFQRLTDLSAGEKGGRRPTLLEEIFGIAEALGATPEQTETVIDHFRPADTSFLMPPAGVPLQPKNMLDIAHESLIRNWELLSGWAAEEVQNARLYQRLQQARLENIDDSHQGWIKGALLQRLEEWRNTITLNYYWAARYHGDRARMHDWAYDKEQLERNMAFLDQCLTAERRREKEKDEAIIEQAKQKQRSRYRIMIITLSVGAAILSALFAAWALFLRNEATAAREIAEQERQKSESMALDANSLREQAEQAKKKSEVSEASAIISLEAQKKASTDVVRLTLAEVERLIYNLNYEAAYSKMETIQSLGVSQKDISDALLEFSFWYAETDRLDRAWAVLDNAYQLVGRTLYGQLRDRETVHSAIRQINPSQFNFLQIRYYPSMKRIPAVTGELRGKCDNTDQNDERSESKIVSVGSFQLAETEITWWQYNLFCAATKQVPIKPSWGISGDNPAVSVSWYDAVEYLNWLSGKFGIQPVYSIDKNRIDLNNNSMFNDPKWTITLRDGANGFRLPTESEWEFAARAGSKFPFAGSNTIDRVAWYIGNSNNHSGRVKSKMANGYGLYDMSGNAREWCWDWQWDEEYLKDNHMRVNPIGSESGSYRVIRGGSWSTPANYCSVCAPYAYGPDFRGNDIGFRPARQVPAIR